MLKNVFSPPILRVYLQGCSSPLSPLSSHFGKCKKIPHLFSYAEDHFSLSVYVFKTGLLSSPLKVPILAHNPSAPLEDEDITHSQKNSTRIPSVPLKTPLPSPTPTPIIPYTVSSRPWRLVDSYDCSGISPLLLPKYPKHYSNPFYSACGVVGRWEGGTSTALRSGYERQNSRVSQEQVRVKKGWMWFKPRCRLPAQTMFLPMMHVPLENLRQMRVKYQ